MFCDRGQTLVSSLDLFFSPTSEVGQFEVGSLEDWNFGQSILLLEGVTLFPFHLQQSRAFRGAAFLVGHGNGQCLPDVGRDSMEWSRLGSASALAGGAGDTLGATTIALAAIAGRTLASLNCRITAVADNQGGADVGVFGIPLATEMNLDVLTVHLREGDPQNIAVAAEHPGDLAGLQGLPGHALSTRIGELANHLYSVGFDDRIDLLIRDLAAGGGQFGNGIVEDEGRQGVAWIKCQEWVSRGYPWS